MIMILCLVITLMTELTSNTATTEMILPILASVAVGMKIHPLLLMVPATISASCAFMMPVATPPNAIVFGSNRITIAPDGKGRHYHQSDRRAPDIGVFLSRRHGAFSY